MSQSENKTPPVGVPPVTPEDLNAQTAVEELLPTFSAPEPGADLMEIAGEPFPAAAEVVPSENEEEESDPLHIGNVVAILSDKYGLVTGRIMYRDAEMMRIVPQETSHKALEFPLINGGGTFDPDLGVSDIEIIEEESSNYFVDVLGARPGETLEFFTLDGEEAAPNGEVEEIIKTLKKDAIRLTDGRIISFRGVGPKLPIAVIRVRASENVDVAPEGLNEEDLEAKRKEEARLATEAARQKDLMALLMGVIPAETVETVPTAERSYPDSMQREDLFQDLLEDIPSKKRTNPRRIRFIEREVDLAMSLKNKMMDYDDAGRVLGPAKYLLETIKDVADVTTGAIPAMIPIVGASRVLNLDEVDINLPFKSSDVTPRTQYEVEAESELIAKMYEDNAAPAFVSPEKAAELREKTGHGFYNYIYDLLQRDQQTLQSNTPTQGKGWAEDQEVIRTAGYALNVEGLGKLGDIKSTNLGLIQGNVEDRYMRVLKADTANYVRTGETYAVGPSDPSAVLGYVMLPMKAGITLRPPKQPGDLPMALLYSAALANDNLPTITQTMKDLYSTEVGTPLTAWGIKADSAVDFQLAEWLQTVLPYAVHPSDALGPRTPRILSLLDAYGLGQHNLSPAVQKILWDWIRGCQQKWRDIIVARRKDIQTALDAEPVRTFQNVTGDDSPLWSTGEGSLKTDPTLTDLVEDIRRRNPTIWNAGSVLTAAFLHEAQGDAAPLVWNTIAKMDSREPPVDEVEAVEALAASRAYTLRRKALQDIGLLSLRAEPEISTCPHAPKLEAIRNVKDNLKRSRLLRDFVEEYRGGDKDDWMMCALCKEPCVCFHEIMELEALSQPTRMETIMKHIRVRFGGDRYIGKIVCKNCGQPLHDIDYDEGVEFDDEGNAMTGRAVLTDEQLEDATQTTWKKVTSTLDTRAPIEFGTPSQKALGEALQTILERGAMNAPEETVRMIVRYADLYVSSRMPTQETYEAERQKLIAMASTKLKRATGTSIATPDIPTYAAFIDQLRVTALTAMTVIALQAADPPIEVLTPFALCPFSRGGWPLEETAKKEDPGALQYVTCVVATIQKETTPWRNVQWAGESSLESRRKKVFAAVAGAVNLIIYGDPKKGVLTFSAEIRTMLTRYKQDEAAIEKRELVSRKDELPSGFRPEPFPPAVGRPVVEKDVSAEVQQALNTGKSVESYVDSVGGALHQQAIAVIGELHKYAETGVRTAVTELPANTVETVCCPATLEQTEAGVLFGKETHQGLLRTRNLVYGGIPSATKAGSHLWPEFSPPLPIPVDQVTDQTVYYKLFLKYCYRGAQVGAPHEFSYGNTCRQCGLSLGKPLELVDINKEGAGILATQQGDLRVEVSQPAFDALSDAVRRRKIVTEHASPAAISWMEALQRLRVVLGVRCGAVSTALEEVLGGISPDREEAPMDEVARAGIWAPLTLLMDELRTAVIAKIGPAIPNQPGKMAQARAQETITAMSMFDRITEEPFVEGPRAVQEYWCAKTESAGNGVAITNVRGAKWFALSKEHNDMLNKILTDDSMWYGGVLTEDPRAILRKMGETLGPILRIWSHYVRGAKITMGPWTVEEAKMLLRTIILQVWRDATNPLSWMYASIAGAADREFVSEDVANWTRALMFLVKRQYVKYSREEIKRILDQRAELERTSVVQEFEETKDEDSRAAMMVLKQYRIGRWSKGANIRTLDADLFEFENEQRRKMGIVDGPVDPIYLEGQQPEGGAAAAGEDFGFGNLAAGAEDGYYGMGEDEDA